MTFALIFNETSNSGKKRFPLPKGHVKVFLSRAYQRCYWRTSFKLGFRSRVLGGEAMQFTSVCNGFCSRDMFAHVLMGCDFT